MRRICFLSILLALPAFLFSFYLMFHTFSYDTRTQSMLIAGKAWSDFGAHIPMIRSFSYGPNLTRLFHGQPIESPLFPGEPIRYHFGFYALVGALEKAGLRIDWALNLPSALGFFLLICTIYSLTFLLFTNHYVAILSVLFFLFNGSLAFLRFFAGHPLNPHTISDIITNSRFPAFGPWDGNTITAFWNLNIYTNQRHLALSYGIILTILFFLLRPIKTRIHYVMRYGILIAVLASLLLFFNYPAALILAMCCASVFIARKETRLPLLIAGTLSLPALVLLTRVAHIGSDIVWQPGYLAAHTDPRSIVQFWIDNIGLHLVLIPVGLILAPKRIRRIFVGPLLVLCILPNLLRFSPDMINNHKFFNFVLIIGNMFSAYAVIYVLRQLGTIPRKQWRIPLQIFVGIVLIGMLTASGFIDLFPIINDTMGAVPDIAANQDARFILRHTPPDAVIANSTWFYHPASIAGRALYSGYTYFTWSYGYDQSAREQQLRAIYSAPTKTELCALLSQDNVSYIELNPRPEAYLSPNWQLWNSLPPIYENQATHLTLYSRDTLCKSHN